MVRRRARLGQFLGNMPQENSGGSNDIQNGHLIYQLVFKTNLCR